MSKKRRKSKMKREFDEIMNHLVPAIAGYEFFTDFKKVYKNILDVEINLNILDTLIGKKETFDQDFISIIKRYPETISVLPLIIAKRGNIDILDNDNNESIYFDFSKSTHNSPEQFLKFVEKSGIKELLIGGHISHLKDYITGVEVGLDSNARKNRSGKIMEGIVEKFLKNNRYDYISQATKKEIKEKWGYTMLDSLNLKEGKAQAEKRFDFAVKVGDELFLIETNYYGGGGSKLNEVSRSYEKLADDINKLPDCQVIWITDCGGWKSTRKNLQESYQHQKNLLTLLDFDLLKRLLDTYLKN